MACDCIAEMNAVLATRNSRICETIYFGGPGRTTVKLEVEKVDRKKRDRAAALPTFCLFCGIRYVPKASDIAAFSQSPAP